jgi:excisionase family DNA binding protein
MDTARNTAARVSRPTTATSPQLLTVAQVAEHLQLAPFSVRRMIWRGELKATLVGCRVRISPDEVERYLKENPWSPELCAVRTARPRAGRRKPKTLAVTPAEPVAEVAPGEGAR